MASTGVEYRGPSPPAFDKKTEGGIAVDAEKDGYDQFGGERRPSYVSVKSVRDFTHRKLKVGTSLTSIAKHLVYWI